MRLNTLLAGFVLVVSMAAIVMGSCAYAAPINAGQNHVLVADGPGPLNPPPIIIWAL